MYRLIKVDFSQTRYQRIFWRDNNNSRLEVYELTTVTYGTFAVSFLVTKCLTHLTDIYADSYLVDSLHVARDFYVDLLTGANTLSEAITIRDQIIQLLN